MNIINSYRFAAAGVPTPLHYWDLTNLTATSGGGIYDQGSGAWGGLDAPSSPSVLSSGAPDGVTDCLDFSRGTYIDTPTAQAWDGAQDQVTIAFWVYNDGTASSRSDLVSWTSGLPSYLFGTAIVNASPDHWWLVHYDSAFYQARDTAEAYGSTATWYFMVFTYDGTDMKIHKGTTTTAPSADNVATLTQAGINYTTNAAEFAIGTASTSKGTSGLSHDGRMFAVGIWDTALSTDEMDYLWNNGDGRTYSQL